MSVRPLPSRLLPVTAVVLVASAVLAVGLAACGSAAPVESPSPSASAPDAAARAVLLAKVRTAVQDSLDGIDEALSVAAGRLAATGLDTPEAQAVLDDLKTGHPEVTDFSTLAPDGTVLRIAPQGSFSGVSIAAPDMPRVTESGAPLLTAPTLVEGRPAAALVHPVTAPDGTVTGAIAAYLETASYLGGLIEPVVEGSGIDKVWVMDRASTQLYDPDATQVGLNVLADPEYDPYPRIRALVKTIAARPEGSGQYDYKDPDTGEPVVKDAAWSTAGLHDTSWRLVLTALVPRTE